MATTFNLAGPFSELCFKQVIVTIILVLSLMAFAVGMIFTKHSSRVMHAQLQGLNTELENLNDEWSKLLLEQATWTSGIRVEKVASEQLQMITPNKVEMIKP